MNKGTNILSLLSTIIALAFFVGAIQAQTTTFTYQGKLSSGGNPATANYDMQFRLFDNPNAGQGTQQGATLTNPSVAATNGIFTVQLDFGSAVFASGATLYLEIAIRPAGNTGGYTLLAPRQQITSAPYAIQSLNAATAANATQLGGVAAANYLQTNGSGANLTSLNASNISSGTLSDTVLSANVARRDTANTFTGDQTVNGNLTQTGTTANLNLTNGFVASGTYNTGAIPASGAGTRMMFYPKKAAFRAGYVSGTQWDDANVGTYSTAMGLNTTASGIYSTAIGNGATANGNFSTAMGFSTTASGLYSTAMGNATTASGPYSTSMGLNTTASGTAAIVMGYFASTNGQSGSFVFGDTSTASILTANALNSWTIRASGGYRFFTNAALTAGVSLSAGGGAWNTLSDRNAKDNIISVNPRDVLRGVLKLPIATWNYKGQPQFQHIGPMAQDFYAAFKVGENDKTITTVDPDGVALAAIQGLNEELKDRDVKIEQQQQQLTVFQERLKQQQTAIDNLRKLVCQTNAQADVCREEK